LLKLIREAFKLAEWACQADIESPAQREEGFKRIETHALKDLSTHAPFGKSTFEVLRVAHHMGIPYRALPAGVFQLGWGRHARLIHRSTTDQDSAIGLHLTRDKFLTAQVLRQASLPAPEHHKARTQGEAEQWATHIGYPVVVKPADLERGEGVTVDVTPSTLATAFETAHRLSPSKTVLIERQVQGVCHRLFIAQGQLLYAVKRLPMGVYGDGRSSINALVQAEYDAQMKRPPWMRSGVSSLHPLPLETLQRQGWSPSDVVPAGLFVALRRIESTAWGGVDEDVTQTAHPDNVQAAIRATKLFGLDVAGVDLICEDITQAWYTHGGVINEVNYAPLLGGGEISRQHLPLYLSRLLKHQGRIPIETLVGEQATWAQGLARWQHWVEAGFPVYLTDGQQTLNPQGHVHPMARQPLREQVQALLMDRAVGALVVVVGIEHTREHKAHE
jgi:cyanophycin synthetase